MANVTTDLMEASMSHDNTNRPKSYPMTPETNYIPWIGGLVALLIVLGAIAMMSRSGQPEAGSNSSATAKSAATPPASR
jgi:hypothetical protein